MDGSNISSDLKCRLWRNGGRYKIAVICCSSVICTRGMIYDSGYVARSHIIFYLRTKLCWKSCLIFLYDNALSLSCLNSCFQGWNVDFISTTALKWIDFDALMHIWCISTYRWRQDFIPIQSAQKRFFNDDYWPCSIMKCEGHKIGT